MGTGKAVVTGLTSSSNWKTRAFTATDFSVTGFGVTSKGERKKLRSGDIWATSCYSGFAGLPKLRFNNVHVLRLPG